MGDRCRKNPTMLQARNVRLFPDGTCPASAAAPRSSASGCGGLPTESGQTAGQGRSTAFLCLCACPGPPPGKVPEACPGASPIHTCARWATCPENQALPGTVPGSLVPMFPAGLFRTGPRRPSVPRGFRKPSPGPSCPRQPLPICSLAVHPQASHPPRLNPVR